MSPGRAGRTDMLPDAGAPPGHPQALDGAARPQAPRAGCHGDVPPGKPHHMTPSICRAIAVCAALALPLGTSTPAPGRLAGAPPLVEAPAVGTALVYRPPVAGSVLRLFDPPARRWDRGHRGVDLSAVDVDVRAPAEGIVTFSGIVVDRGVVTVTHPDGLRSSLEPVDDAPPVGTVVALGDELGHVGAGAHCPGQPCVHWGVRRGEEYLDPLDLLGTVTVVLLPAS